MPWHIVHLHDDGWRKTACAVRATGYGYLTLAKDEWVHCSIAVNATQTNAEWLYGTSLHGSGWISSSNVRKTNEGLESFLNSLKQMVRISSHCLERPERYVDGDIRLTELRIREVMEFGECRPTFSHDGTRRFTFVYEKDAVVTDLQGSCAITWIPNYKGIPPIRYQCDFMQHLDQKKYKLDYQKQAVVKERYDAVEYNGRGQRCFGYLRVEENEFVFVGSLFPGAASDRFLHYRYACSSRGQGWIPTSVLEAPSPTLT